MRLTNYERLAIAVVALVGAAAFTVSVYARVSQETENFNQTVAFPSGGTLELHNFSGDVHITGTSGKDVVIKAVRRASRDRLDHIKLDVKTSSTGVRIEANKRDSGWEDHNRLMMYWACLGTARVKGWDYVRAFSWWPQVEAISFVKEKPWLSPST